MHHGIYADSAVNISASNNLNKNEALAEAEENEAEPFDFLILFCNIYHLTARSWTINH